MHSIEYLMEDAKTKLQYVSQAIEESEREVTFLRSNKLFIDADIKEVLNKLVETLHERVNVLRKQANDTSESMNAKFTEHITELCVLASNLEDCLHLGRSTANNPALSQAVIKALVNANAVNLNLPETGNVHLNGDIGSVQSEINNFGFVEVTKEVSCSDMEIPEDVAESDDGISVVSNVPDIKSMTEADSNTSLGSSCVKESPPTVEAFDDDSQQDSNSTSSSDNPWLMSSQKVKVEQEVKTVDLALTNLVHWIKKELPSSALQGSVEETMADQLNPWLNVQQKNEVQAEMNQWLKVDRPIKKAVHSREKEIAAEKMKAKEEWLFKTDEKIMEICADVEDLCLDKQNEDKVVSWLKNCNDFEPVAKKKCTKSAFGVQNSFELRTSDDKILPLEKFFQPKSQEKGFVKLINRHTEDDRSWLLYPQSEIEGNQSSQPLFMESCSNSSIVERKSEEVVDAGNDVNWVSVSPYSEDVNVPDETDTYICNASDLTDTTKTNNPSISFQSDLDHMRSILEGDSSDYLVRPPAKKQVNPEDEELLCNWLAGRADSRCGECPSECSYDRVLKSSKWYKTVANW